MIVGILALHTSSLKQAIEILAKGSYAILSSPQKLTLKHKKMNCTMKRFWEILRRYWNQMDQREVVNPFVVKEDACKPNERSKSADLGELLQEFLNTRYDFRYNLLTEETEFRPHGQANLAYLPIDQRQLNTLCMDARTSGIACWDRDLCRYIYSTRIASYHPIRLFMDELPAWDGRDRLDDLAKRVSDNRLWMASFHTWMRAVTAQWMGLEGVHANSVAPMLISSEQGCQKSTFCKVLLPERLYRHYTDSLELTSQGQAERKLAEMALINLDEFDKYSPKKMPLIKNLLQMASLNLRKSHQKQFRLLPRVASFIGTSNRKDLLCDPSGSRRFICIEVDHPIEVNGIEHEQVYAQLKAELLSGATYWFSKAEERAIQQHNMAFYRVCPAEEVLRACFRAPLPEEEYLLLSSADIFKELKRYNGAAMQGANPAQFAQVLTAAGIERKHTNRGNVYKVMPQKQGEAVVKRSEG